MAVENWSMESMSATVAVRSLIPIATMPQKGSVNSVYPILAGGVYVIEITHFYPTIMPSVNPYLLDGHARRYISVMGVVTAVADWSILTV